MRLNLQEHLPRLNVYVRLSTGQWERHQTLRCVSIYLQFAGKKDNVKSLKVLIVMRTLLLGNREVSAPGG